jgi:nucleotide-binding universal stress UspA family protein
MFQHILVPLDGSTRAEQVLPVAARLARASGATIRLLTVVDSVHEAVSYRMTGPYMPPDTIEWDFTAAQSYLDQVAQQYLLVGISVEKQVDLGNPAMMILSNVEALAEQPIDLIVMSSHGYTGFQRWLLGSVAEKIARQAPVPVLILREGESVRFAGMSAIRALVPVDTSARSLDAIPPAAQIVAALSSPKHGHLQLTQIVVMPEHVGKKEGEELLREARQNLGAIEQRIGEGLVADVGPDLHLTLSWALSMESDIAEGIVRLAENGEQFAEAGDAERCDLIAMTTHGSTGLERWAVGSITERVLHATRLPLLIVRPADMIEKQRRQRECQVQAAQ